LKRAIFMDKYPVYGIELDKSEISCKTIDEVVEYFKEKIANHPIAAFISVFDHYNHTKTLKGEMPEGLIDAKNVIFCFGAAIPSTKVLALRPRSIGICEFEDKFIIDFLEAPIEKLHDVMEGWTKDLLNK
jgi:hypothetical protein